MDEQSHPNMLRSPVHIQRAACLTALGNAKATADSLLDNQCALEMTPIYAEDGGEPVPLALRNEMKSCLPPRWWNDLLQFLKPLEEETWGTSRRPVIVCSSNYGIDGLYGLARERSRDYSAWATPHGCMDMLLSKLNWGTNITILSHACVSAQLGLYKAAELLHANVADEVLVLSFDYVGPFVASGFHSLKILNSNFPAPYEDRETGSVGLGDGLAYAVLNKNGPGPVIHAQSLYNEMFHFTANAPDGIGFKKALIEFTRLLDRRRILVKGHGTGTLEAGRMEAEACSELFADSPLVSWKGAIGHTLGSCALVELVIALACLEEGRIPGTVGTTGSCFSDTVALKPFYAAPYDFTLLLSNAFGGAHGAMLISHD